ncbi:MAG: YeeE/YedE family protein [Afipia sp.]|nr:YeeE/YedE family protein [Afipia sp.]OJW64739.1 MAG: hypothetical protein BGO65_05595 [Afipia sp. 64-13]
MELAPLQLALWGGLALGVMFGAVAQATAFCSSGAITDWVRDGDSNRLRAWGLAAAVAIFASQLMIGFGILSLDKSMYLAAPLAFGGLVLGGVMFGIGMILAQGCPARNLVRLGGGNLRALVVVLVFAASAYATMRGVLAPLRANLEAATRSSLGASGIPELIARYAQVDSGAGRWVIALGAAAMLAMVCLASRSFRNSPRDLVAGLVVGLLVAGGWYLTGVIAYDEFNAAPPASLTFVAPLGDSLQYLLLYTGASANFGIALIGGVLLGACAMALARRRFRLEGFGDQNDFFRQIAGAALMGVGGVLAMGCTVGQGLTGLSTLSLGSLIAASSIVLGGYIGARWSAAGNTACGADVALEPAPSTARS